MKRVVADIIIFVVPFVLFAFHYYSGFSAPIQLVLLKAMLVSAGILHAHIARKLLFPKVNWEESKFKASTIVAISFYIVIPLCYTFAG